MTYTQLLNTALELLDEQGPQQAWSKSRGRVSPSPASTASICWA